MSDIQEMLWDQVKSEVYQKLEVVAEHIEGLVAKKISNYKPSPIYDKGNFLNKLTHEVKEQGNSFEINVWSKAPHSQYVLGGSYYDFWKPPIKPLKAWVYRKRMDWLKKKDGTPDIEAMAYVIRESIYKKGIKERNVFEQVLLEELDNIKKRFDLE
jgi:hypothetical protein